MGLYNTVSMSWHSGAKTKYIGIQRRIQEFEKGGSFKRVHKERGDNFRVTTPTFAKPRPF